MIDSTLFIIWYKTYSDRHYYAGAERVCTAIPIQYLPFRESYVCNHTPSPYTERFTFTGKERDEETGYTYHGARYFDAALLTSWMAVDPMSDKYPSMSPYNYCAWNPVKLVDENGREITPPDHHIINVTTGDVSTIASKHNSISVIGNGVKKSVSFPNGDFSVDFKYSNTGGCGSCSITASGGTDYDYKMFSMSYFTYQDSPTIRQPNTIDGMAIPEVMSFQAEPWSVGLSATFIANVGLTLSLGMYNDGLGNNSFYFSFGVGVGFDAGIGLSYTNYSAGTSPSDNSSYDISGNLGIGFVNGGYNVLSDSWSIGGGYGFDAGASMTANWTKIF